MSPANRSGAFQIRRMRPGDAVWLGRAAESLFDHPADRLALGHYLSDPRNLFFLATAGDQAVGFLRGTALGQLHTRRRQMFLYEVAVARRYRRRGVGTLLIEHLLEFCRAHAFEEAFVFTDPKNRAAVQLYRSTGAVTETPRDRMFVYRLARRSPRSPD